MTTLPERLRASAKVLRRLEPTTRLSFWWKQIRDTDAARIARELEEAAQALEAGPWIRTSDRRPPAGALIVKRWCRNGAVWAGIYSGTDKDSSFDEWIALPAPPSAQVAQEGAAGVLAADNWQQYAKDGETAQACIERHRREQDTLLKLLAQSREPLTSEQIIALLPAGWTGMLAQVMEFARRIEAARGVATDGGSSQ